METIKSKADFQKVFSHGKRAGHRLVRISVLEKSMDSDGRVAFVAARRLGNAVWRNRSKRVLREAARAMGLPQQGKDVILFATYGTHDAHPNEVARALDKLLNKERKRG